MTLAEEFKEIARRLAPHAQPFEGRTILCTGTGGFLGRWMVGTIDALNAHVLRKPCKLVAVDLALPTPDKTKDLVKPETIEFLARDFSKPFEIAEHVDFAVHMAGIASPVHYRRKPLETLDISFFGTRQMLEIAKRDKARMMFFSSSEIYGDPDPKFVPTPETYRGNVSSMGPRACYDEGKRIGETLAYIYANHFDVHTVVVRPFNVYGPLISESDYRVLVNYASLIKADQPVQMYGDGRQTRTYCYTADAVTGFWLALLRGRKGEAYNIGNEKPELSILDLVAKIESVLGKPIKKQLVKYPDHYPPDEPNRRCPDLAKSRVDLGYEPTVPIEEGLKRFLGWSQANFTGRQ